MKGKEKVIPEEMNKEILHSLYNELVYKIVTIIIFYYFFVN